MANFDVGIVVGLQHFAIKFRLLFVQQLVISRLVSCSSHLKQMNNPSNPCFSVVVCLFCERFFKRGRRFDLAAIVRMRHRFQGENHKCPLALRTTPYRRLKRIAPLVNRDCHAFS